MPPAEPFLPEGFDLPQPPRSPLFTLEALGPEHNASDYAAWSTSIAFIRSLPGWATGSWPHPMSLEENLEDLRRHAERSRTRQDFAWTVLLPGTHQVVGCVYLTPANPPEPGAATARSWVTQTRAELDKPLYDVVHDWLTTQWPFRSIEYAARA